MLIPSLGPGLCLAYVNTRFWRGRAAPTETLADFAVLLDWLGRSAALTAAELRKMAGWARANPAKAAGAFAAALALREALFRCLAARAAGRPVSEADFARLRRAIARSPARRRLARSRDSFAWRIGDIEPSPSRLLAPVLWSAADLMVEGAPGRLRQCASGECQWLFLDASKNATRRWCDMASCGNRAKARRHYLKAKRAAGATPGAAAGTASGA